MDFFAHGLWSYIAGYKLKKPLYAVFFGLFPDIISWVVYTLFLLISGGELGRPVAEEIPRWVFTLYGISHSLIVVTIIFLIIFLIVRKIPLFLWTWPMHIFMDIPTHRRDFLPTPFLWPLSDWTFPGISWAEPWSIILNYTIIIICLLVIWTKYGKKLYHHGKRSTKIK